MPGAQPRRGFETRVGSTARRGAYAPPGVPGVYRVPRVRVQTVASDRGSTGRVDPNPWIQPPDDTTSPELTYVLTTVEGDEVADVDFPAEAEAAMDLLRTDGGASLTALIGSRYDTEGAPGAYQPVAFLSHAVLPPGFSLPAIFIPTSDYPDNAIDVEYEDPQGTFLSVVLNAEIDRTVTEGSLLLRVPDDEWSETTNYGLGYFTPAELATFDVLEDIPATSGALSVAEPFDLDPNGGAVFVLANDRQVTGTGWIPNDGGILLWDSDTEVVVTYRPPRYRFIYADAAPWTASVLRNEFVWDAGEFLGSTFSDLTGYPLTLPASAAQLSYYVVPPGFDFVGNSSAASPQGRVHISSGGNVGPFVNPGGATTPDAGSHLWVSWLGPGFDITTDPAPDEAPAGLVPAALAEFGTA